LENYASFLCLAVPAPRATRKGWVGAIQIPKFILFIYLLAVRTRYSKNIILESKKRIFSTSNLVDFYFPVLFSFNFTNSALSHL
jgi:hypothetical protein